MNPLVSVVITSYNRPALLEKTVRSFLAHNTYAPIELVLADDGSDESAKRKMKELPFDTFEFADENSGLGANTNRGLGAAKGDFILQLQDDWECIDSTPFLADSVALFDAHPEVGLIKLTDRHHHLNYASKMVEGAGTARFYDHKGEQGKFYYSDNPHIKTRAFVNSIGPYKESRYMQRTELDMRDRFLRQEHFIAAYIEGHNTFRHIGEDQSHRTLLPLARVGRFMDRYPGLNLIAQLWRKLRNV
jgi:glycosyltransferase involved in cell wall biosynthesis